MILSPTFPKPTMQPTSPSTSHVSEKKERATASSAPRVASNGRSLAESSLACARVAGTISERIADELEKRTLLEAKGWEPCHEFEVAPLEPPNVDRVALINDVGESVVATL